MLQNIEDCSGIRVIDIRRSNMGCRADGSLCIRDFSRAVVPKDLLAAVEATMQDGDLNIPAAQDSYDMCAGGYFP